MSKKVFDYTQLAYFCNQSAIFLNAGISLYEGMAIMAQDTRTEAEKKVYSQISEELGVGMMFSQAVSDTGVFPEYLTDMAAIGEMSGNLDRCMSALAQYYEMQQDIKDNINSAVRYPAAMIAMMLVVITVLAVKVMPVFAQIYSVLDVQASGVMSGITGAGGLLAKVCVGLCAVFAVICGTVFGLNRTDTGRQKLAGFMMKFPLTKDIYTKTAEARFAQGMHMMLASGVDVSQAVQMTMPTVEHPDVKAKIAKISQAVSIGGSFEDAVSEVDLFTKMEQKMLTVSGRAGRTDSAMEKISQDYTKRVYTEINNKISVVEPVLVSAFAVIIGMVLLRAVLPLAGILTSMI